MSIRRISLISLFSGILCVLVYVIPPIPLLNTGVSFTVQTMLVVLFGLILRPKDSFLSLIIYLIIGVIGIPVFSGKLGGLGVILGPTGGFLVCFPFAALMIGLCRYKFNKPFLLFSFIFLIMIVGLYLFSTLWYCIATNNFNYFKVLISFIPFMVVDLIKIILAVIIYKTIPNEFIEDLNNIKKGL